MTPRTKAYCINMKPIPWQRARLHGSQFFDAQKRDKLAFGLFVLQQHNDELPFDKAIDLSVEFCFLKPTHGNREHHQVPPDLDNCLKFLLDAIVDAGIITDDKLVCSLSAKKVYDKEPRTEFIITEVL